MFTAELKTSSDRLGEIIVGLLSTRPIGFEPKPPQLLICTVCPEHAVALSPKHTTICDFNSKKENSIEKRSMYIFFTINDYVLYTMLTNKQLVWLLIFYKDNT